jgi:DNA-binding response OmpR family regulator
MNTDKIRKEKILIVDDDRVVQSLLGRILTFNNYEVESMRTAEEAIIALEKDKFDAMILDLELPGMSGIEFLDRLPQKYNDMPLIILTAHGSLDSAIRAIRFKVSDYLLKPVKREDVLKSIKKAIIENRIEQNEKSKDSIKTQGEKYIQSDEIKPYGNVIINFNKRLVIENDHSISLTNNETKILYTLIQNQHRVISHSDLVKATQGYDIGMIEAAKILRPVICRLRKKLEKIRAGDHWIQNIRGTGYLLEFPE